MGEAVGKAAWICVYHHCSPNDVYEQHLPLFTSLLEQPGVMRRESIANPLQLPPGMTVPPVATVGINPASLPGIVKDDADAKLVGDWSSTVRSLDSSAMVTITQLTKMLRHVRFQCA